ncbi:HNH endonuclease signature motif containing protein [Bacillus subtilis]
MKLLKNSICLLVLTLLIATIGFSPQTKAAEENSFGLAKPVTIEEKETLTVDKNGVAKSTNDDQASVIKNARQLANQSDHNEITYKNPAAKEENNIVNVPVVEKKDEKAHPKAASLVSMSYTTIYDPNKKSITTTIKIASIVGEKPIVIEARNDLYDSNTYSGKYGRVFVHSREFLGKDIKVGKSYSKSYYPKKTKFYMSQHTTVAGWKGTVPDTSTGTLAPVLANKIGWLYPEIRNNHSKKTMPVPAKANFPIIPKDDREEWDSSDDRNNYIKKYIKTYGDPKWNWSGLDIHHVLPREYGGDNSFNNLFPLPRDMHQQILNPWWMKY